MRTRTLVVSLILFCLAVFTAAFVVYDRSQVTSETATVDKTPLVRDYSPIIGPEDAPVTIVEFFDPSCEGCRAMHPYVKQIQAAYPEKVRLVLRYVLFHKGSEEAVRILETAREQKVYKPVLDAVMEAQPQWHDDPDIKAAWDAAKSAGLDVEAARASMNSPEIDGIIQQDAADVKGVGISGTPTFYVNGEKLSRLGPQELYDLVTSKVESSK
ncbi:MULTISPECIES: thioredoxin domain-containing protein [unclassified Marinobacter]|uniref:DsbA family protein n=1 Tax=unclassified Marinobacter TaxID=83889 RepID=UPI000C952320|nr:MULTISPECIES: thioredoxin domain-containing protein [unclassified Marinobacter]MAI31017.1 disulfide bond formation protein DsbA [Rhodopirellula sp.]MDK8465863.1 thioredoxin domain-containing protein [Marinobacter sp. SS13-12]ROQ43401.1 protein-disulfide isomerase [Marinobacter sp. 3-2]